MKLLSDFPQDDVLSELLRSIHVRSTVYCHSELTAPWGFSVDARIAASFHLILAGECWLEVQDIDQRIPLASGDLVILPRGHAHQLRDNLSRRVRALEEILASQAIADGWRLRYGGGGARTELLCGGFVIEDRDALPALAVLPPVIHIQSQNGQPVEWLEAMLTLLRQEMASGHLGSEAIVTKLTDVLLAQAIRRYRPSLDDVQLLGAATVKDQRIASALRLIHEQPQYAWTADALAARVAMSRSAFSTRFRLVIGQSPMRYLTCYRLTRVANRLRTSGESLLDMALQHGYASDVALSKAFKRYFGMSPGAYRHAIQDVSATALSATLLRGMDVTL